jgi:hypothetical protein
VKDRRAAAKASGGEYSLADLGWIDGYTGQTVDEILLFESTETVPSLLFTLEEAVQKKIEVAGPGKVTGTEQTLLAVLALSREVNNGGYDQFFRNSSRRFAPTIVNHLVRIGCREIADITQRALDALGVEQPTLKAIEAAMATPSVERDRALNRCDLAFYACKGLLDSLFAYVKTHPDGIRI